jgi:hypothetical protein
VSVAKGTNLLRRMQAAHRQTRGYLARIEHQITARAERMTTTAKAKARRHPSGGSRWTRSDETMFRACADQLSFERRGEIDVLNRKLSRQERAILAVRAKTFSNGPAANADVQTAL